MLPQIASEESVKKTNKQRTTITTTNIADEPQVEVIETNLETASHWCKQEQDCRFL